MSEERQALEERSPWWGEHVHRYNVVKQYLQPNFNVLDIACGTGFGSALMAESVPSGNVTGCDISAEAVQHNAQHFSQVPNLKFEAADATNLQFADNTFDLVASFETLEHVDDYEAMLRELRRVLKPGGRLVLSTPNFPVNSPSGVVTNPYHVREFTYDQMRQMFPPHFPDFKLYGQQYIRYKNAKGLGMKIGKGLENLLYMRGFRKLPLGMQDAIVRPFTHKPMYPQPQDYDLVEDPAQAKLTKTFVVLATKPN